MKHPTPTLTGARVTPDAARSLLPILAEMVPDPRCELDFRAPFELLIATQLSAQSTDAMVNKVTPTLFARWPDAAALAQADPEELEAVLRPTGFFRQKSKNAIATARLLVAEYGGEVPARMEDLVRMPGAARKTANVVLGTAFGIQSGVTVDTHAFRVTRRWGWHDEATPEKVEPILMALVPQEGWSDFGHRAVLFGRHHCTARKPACGTCLLQDRCVAFRDGSDGAGLADPEVASKPARPRAKKG